MLVLAFELERLEDFFLALDFLRGGIGIALQLIDDVETASKVFL